MDAFPAFIPLEGRTVVVVGDGEMADAKARLFDGSPARLIRYPEGDAALGSDLYQGAALVFIASDNVAFAAAAAAAARSAGARLVNVVDRPAMCDFYTPALVDRGAVVAAVGTTGSGPLLAQRLKETIDRVLPAGLGTLANVLKAVQPDVRVAFPDFTHRRAFLTSLLEGAAATAALAGDAAAGERLAREALRSATEPVEHGAVRHEDLVPGSPAGKTA